MIRMTQTAALEVQESKDLCKILDAQVNMVTLKRVPSRVTQAAFGALAENMKGEFRSLVTEATYAAELKAFLGQFNTTAIQREIILSEVGQLLTMMLKLGSERRAQLVFGLIDSDHCRLFHADHNELRMVCTFRGKGTEYLLNADVNRDGLGQGTNDGHIAGRPIQRLGTFDVGIMKGERFLGNDGNGLVHRSPPRLDGDSARIFLAIDVAARPRHPAKPAPSNEDLVIHKFLFPLKKRKWRFSTESDAPFCKQVRQRFEESMAEQRQAQG